MCQECGVTEGGAAQIAYSEEMAGGGRAWEWAWIEAESFVDAQFLAGE